MFRAPNFNLSASVWNNQDHPVDGPPALADIPAQLYFTDKDSSGYQITFNWFNTPPPIWVRMPKGALGGSSNGFFNSVGIIEVPQGTGTYIAVNFSMDCHTGFQNEYMTFRGVKCDDAGNLMWGGCKAFSTYWPSDYPPHAP